MLDLNDRSMITGKELLNNVIDYDEVHKIIGFRREQSLGVLIDELKGLENDRENKRIVKGVLRQFAPVVKVEVTSLSPNQLLKGRSALITGGTSGIGFQIARSFLYAGARVIITGRNQKRVDEACQKLLQECEDWKDNIHGIEMDVTKINQLEQSFQDMIKSVGGIDILVNNAGLEGGISILVQRGSLMLL